MSSKDHAIDRPITIAMLALGGQGGGVLTRWLVDIAEANGYLAQSTYVAGVAQRTGATVYCVEIYPAEPTVRVNREPVFTLYPVPGDVDLVIAGEMAETGRAIQKGFVTPNCTTLLASTHRVYSISEKEAMGDGIMDQAPVAAVASKVAKRFISFDMEAAAQETGSIISSVMLGAIAATEVLPFARAAFEQAIRDTGKAVENNLRGFEAGFNGVTGVAPVRAEKKPRPPQILGANGRALADQINANFPESAKEMAKHGALRCLDYQDRAYGDDYLRRLLEVYKSDIANGGEKQQHALTLEVARQLALQMCYEDIVRVADLKTRGSRAERVRDQVAATDEQPVHVVEYFHPRIEEVCDILPVSIGKWLLTSPRARKLIAPPFRKGRNIRTSTITGFMSLRLLAGLRRWRRGTYRFAVQQQLIGDWLADIRAELKSDYDGALAIANCIEMVKGYGDTYERGLSRYRETLKIAAKASSGRGTLIRRLRAAAEADEKGLTFARAKSELETVH